MDSCHVTASRGERMKPPTNQSLRYFVAMITTMASTLREFEIPEAAESLEKAKAQIEARFSNDEKLVR